MVHIEEILEEGMVQRLRLRYEKRADDMARRLDTERPFTIKLLMKRNNILFESFVRRAIIKLQEKYVLDVTPPPPLLLKSSKPRPQTEVSKRLRDPSKSVQTEWREMVARQRVTQEAANQTSARELERKETANQTSPRDVTAKHRRESANQTSDRDETNETLEVATNQTSESEIVAGQRRDPAPSTNQTSGSEIVARQRRDPAPPANQTSKAGSVSTNETSGSSHVGLRRRGLTNRGESFTKERKEAERRITEKNESHIRWIEKEIRQLSELKGLLEKQDSPPPPPPAPPSPPPASYGMSVALVGGAQGPRAGGRAPPEQRVPVGVQVTLKEHKARGKCSPDDILTPSCRCNNVPCTCNVQNPLASLTKHNIEQYSRNDCKKQSAQTEEYHNRASDVFESLADSDKCQKTYEYRINKEKCQEQVRDDEDYENELRKPFASHENTKARKDGGEYFEYDPSVREEYQITSGNIMGYRDFIRDTVEFEKSLRLDARKCQNPKEAFKSAQNYENPTLDVDYAKALRENANKDTAYFKPYNVDMNTQYPSLHKLEEPIRSKNVETQVSDTLKKKSRVEIIDLSELSIDDSISRNECRCDCHDGSLEKCGKCGNLKVCKRCECSRGKKACKCKGACEICSCVKDKKQECIFCACHIVSTIHVPKCECHVKFSSQLLIQGLCKCHNRNMKYFMKCKCNVRELKKARGKLTLTSSTSPCPCCQYFYMKVRANIYEKQYGTRSPRSDSSQVETPQDQQERRPKEGKDRKEEKKKTLEYQKPREYEQTDSEHQKPSSEYQKSSSEYQKPSSEYQKSSSEYQKSSSEYQKPRKYDQSDLDNQQLSSEYQKPSSVYRKPSSEYQKPNGYSRKPVAKENRSSPNINGHPRHYFLKLEETEDSKDSTEVELSENRKLMDIVTIKIPVRRYGKAKKYGTKFEYEYQTTPRDPPKPFEDILNKYKWGGDRNDVFQKYEAYFSDGGAPQGRSPGPPDGGDPFDYNKKEYLTKSEVDREKRLKEYPSLQECLASNRPDFCNNAEYRRQLITDMAKEREESQALRLKCLTNFMVNPQSRGLEGKGSKRIFSTTEMKEQTRKSYRKLTEVTRKQADEKKKEEYRTNKLMAEIFAKRLQLKTLQGQVNLSNSQCVLSTI